MRSLYKIIILFFCTLGLGKLAFNVSQSNPIQPSSSGLDSPRAAIAATVPAKVLPSYRHVFVIIAENRSYGDIIGNINAPNINRLAKTYGSATQFYGIMHPSQPNYINMLGGSSFGITDNNAFYCNVNSKDRFCGNQGNPNYPNHTIAARSFIDQLEEKNLTWKGYFESIPVNNLKAIVYPSVERPLYAAKHNGFLSFKRVQNDSKLAQKIVAIDQLDKDLINNKAPNYSHIVFNQCHDMHGVKDECNNAQELIKTGDTYINTTVQKIMASKLWRSPENSAIVITWDEDSNSQMDPKVPVHLRGGHIATVVITNHGLRGVVDNNVYNHYSMLRTMEEVFGMSEYLNGANNPNTGGKVMTSLFKVPSK